MSISCFGVISNTMRNRYLKVPDKPAAANSGIILFSGLLIILFITQKGAMLIATIPSFSTPSAHVLNLSFCFCAIPAFTLPHKDSL